MLKFRSPMDDGKTLIGFGLSKENIKRLLLGQPIYFEGSEVGSDHNRYLIFAGENETEMLSELRKQGFDVRPGVPDGKEQQNGEWRK